MTLCVCGIICVHVCIILVCMCMCVCVYVCMCACVCVLEQSLQLIEADLSLKVWIPRVCCVVCILTLLPYRDIFVAFSADLSQLSQDEVNTVCRAIESGLEVAPLRIKQVFVYNVTVS